MMPEFFQGALKPGQAKQLAGMLRDATVLLFVIDFLEKCEHGEAKLIDLYVIISHLAEESNSSFNFKTADFGLGEASDHLKVTNVTNIFSNVLKLVFRSFGSDYTHFFKLTIS